MCAKKVEIDPTASGTSPEARLSAARDIAGGNPHGGARSADVDPNGTPAAPPLDRACLPWLVPGVGTSI